MNGYVFSHDIRVRFAETDAQGIAHHAGYVVWLEEARIAYLDAYAGGYKAIQAQGIEALTTGIAIEYRRAAAFHDVLRIWTRCAEVKGARFRYEYAIERDGEEIATGETRHATVDRKTLRPVRVPLWFAEAVAAAEGRDHAPVPAPRGRRGPATDAHPRTSP